MAGAGFGAYEAAYSSDSIYGVDGKKLQWTKPPARECFGRIRILELSHFLSEDDRFPKMTCESVEGLSSLTGVPVGLNTIWYECNNYDLLKLLNKTLLYVIIGCLTFKNTRPSIYK